MPQGDSTDGATAIWTTIRLGERGPVSTHFIMPRHSAAHAATSRDPRKLQEIYGQGEGCGGDGERCCAGGYCDYSINICQAGYCEPPSVLTAYPSSLSVEAGDGITGNNTSNTYLYTSGYWAVLYPNASPSLSISVNGLPPGQMPPGINMPVMTNDTYPPTVEFSAGSNAAGGTYTFEITGTLGAYTAAADVELNVSACQPFTCAEGLWVCGLMAPLVS